MDMTKMGQISLYLCAGLIVWLCGPARGYIEMVEEYGCHDNEFRLTCRHLDSHIAILEATFYPDDPAGNVSCGIQNTTTNVVGSTAGAIIAPTNVNITSASNAINYGDLEDAEDTSMTSGLSRYSRLRLPLNRRCSGLNHCNFILISDAPGANTWGSGLVAFKYACFSAYRVTHFCNTDIILSGNGPNEGFAQSPGYPKYYIGIEECRWRFSAAVGQTIQIMLLDISLRSIGPHESGCMDRLSVIEDGHSLLETCQEHPLVTTIVSTGNSLDVVINIKSKKMFPKRGILFHYKALGCPTPTSPLDGYLVWRNDSFAEFMCCVGFVFPDTLRRVRTLHCLNRNTWSLAVPDCINTTEPWDINSTVIKEQPTHKTTSMMFNDTSTLYDVVIPTAVIAALFIVNAFVILIIYKYRKRKLLMNQEEEMAVIFAEEPATIS